MAKANITVQALQNLLIHEFASKFSARAIRKSPEDPAAFYKASRAVAARAATIGVDVSIMESAIEANVAKRGEAGPTTDYLAVAQTTEETVEDK